MESVEGNSSWIVWIPLYSVSSGISDNRNHAQGEITGTGNCHISGYCLVLFHGFSVRGKGDQKSDYRSDRKIRAEIMEG